MIRSSARLITEKGRGWTGPASLAGLILRDSDLSICKLASVVDIETVTQIHGEGVHTALSRDIL